MSRVLEGLAEKMKHYRKQMGISQEELASKTGLSLSLIRGIERKAANPTLSSLEKLAEAFEISLPELFNYNNELDDSKKITNVMVKELRQLPADKLRLMLQFIRAATK